jgi:predicted RNase H-like nuclease (RuvC/YqgF family)
MREDNYVVRKQYVGLSEGSDGQVILSTGDADLDNLIRTSPDESAARGNGAGDDIEALRGQVETLQEQVQSTSGAVIEAEGLRNQLAELQQKADEQASEADSLRTQLADLKAKAAAGSTDSGASGEGSEQDALDKLTTAQIKEQLDAKGITYKASDAKPELLAALKAAQ